MRRGFVEVGGRRVHFRHGGHGPPLVMLHGSPGDSEMLAPEMAACADDFSVFALDTPGFGYSDALPGATLAVRDLAGATAAAMVELGLPACRVYGTHTGAAIALELGAGWPHLVSGLVMEGVPAFTQAEISAYFEGYFAPMVPDPLGGHLISNWVRFRDQFTWFPWPSRDVRRLNAVDRPAPADIDVWVSMFYRACRHYRPAYTAACHYGQAAIAAASALSVPAIYMTGAEDMLFGHLDRLPPLKAGQRIERLAHDHAAKMRAIAGFAREMPGGTAAFSAPVAMGAGADPRWMFADTTWDDGIRGQMFLRVYGRPDRPGVVLLHDGPGTGLSLDAVARDLARDFRVIVPDLPGCGLSGAPASGSVLEAAAAGVVQCADAVGVGRFTVAALGCGCAVAAILARDHGGRLDGIVAAGMDLPPPSMAELLAPPIEIRASGSHWVEAWLMLRDGQIYQPWFDGRVAAQRRVQGNFDAEWLHDQTVALMAGRATYHRLAHEALRFPVAETLRGAGLGVRLVDSGGHGSLVEDVRNLGQKWGERG